jgi:uncharacterized RDD family membrane protein YckC
VALRSQTQISEVAMAETENVTGKRIVAALIDFAILGVVFALFVFLFGDTETTSRAPDGTTTHGFQFNLNGWPFVLYLVAVLVYYAAAELVFAATPGKLALGLRVVSADETPLTSSRIIVRNLLRLVDALPFLYIVGIIAIAASRRDQRVGDMAARTVVVSADRTNAPSGAVDLPQPTP